MKKTLALLLSLALILTLFAGCSKKPSADGAPASDSSTDEPDASLDGEPETSSDGDFAYIKEKGSLIVGITNFAPMDYKEEGSDEWTGFDAEFARAFGEYIGVDVQFIEIDWDNKFFELDDKKIDCIWNGMTITDEVKLNTSVSKPYVKNEQVVVMAKDKLADYPDVESLKDLEFAVETGSAGENAANDNELKCVPVSNQANALTEVEAGTADACIIDSTMAASMTGEGTNYSDLGAGVTLTSEEYGVAFRQNSDAVGVFNKFLDTYDGLKELASAYNLTLVEQ